MVRILELRGVSVSLEIPVRVDSAGEPEASENNKGRRDALLKRASSLSAEYVWSAPS
jgi:hypothetical protein